MMDFALRASTASGSRFVSLAEQHAADFATRADQHDEFLQVLRRAQRFVARRRWLLGDVTTPHPCAGRNEQARAGQDDEEA